MSTNPSYNENTYVMDAESAAETARLMNQDRILTRTMGGVFPERPDLSNAHDILDIGCGPGGWVLDVAYEYPEIQIMGIDISHTTIRYARAQAKVQGLDNTSFRVMNALKPLEFPDNSFDVVNARFIMGFMPTTAWPDFLQECMRILRPGGLMRLTEAEYGVSTSSNVNDLGSLVAQLLKRIGYSFSPDGKNMGIAPVMAPMLRKAGFQDVKMMSHVMEASAGTEAYGPWTDNIKVMFQIIQPILFKMRVISQEEMDQLYQNAVIDMLSDDFYSIGFSLTVWGHKL